MSEGKFIFPPKIELEDYSYHGCNSYSHYNYLRKGIIPSIKRRHFKLALNLAQKGFHRFNVIDFGCADGILLPTLSHYFPFVLGIEKNEIFLSVTQKIVETTVLENVQIINNKDLSIEDITKKLQKKEFKIIFLLEVLEHIGNNWKTQYDDKMIFLKSLFSLINKDGIIVISVPKMVGMSFFIQHSALFLLNMNRSRYSLKDFIKAVLFRDTSGIENRWVPDTTHMGFNHKTLEKFLNDHFSIIKIKNDFFQILYVIQFK